MLAAGGAYLAALVRSAPEAFAPALIEALAVDQVLRALGNTFDLSIQAEFLLSQIAISLGLATLAVWSFVTRSTNVASSGKLSVTGELATGAGLFVITSLLALPNAIARWSDFEYAAIAPVLVALTCTPLFPPFRDWTLRGQTSRGKIGQIAMVLIGLAIGYPGWGIWSAMGLLAACAALLLSLTSLIELDDAKANRTGLSLSLGLLLLLEFNIAMGFAFTYPYTVRLMQGMGLPL